MNETIEKRRARAQAALRAVPDSYEEGEEGIAEAIGDLAHLAAAQGPRRRRSARPLPAQLRSRGRHAAEPQRRYALLVVVEAAGPEAAWEAIRGTAGHLEGDGEPDCIHIGGPWEGVPGDAEDIATEGVRVAFSRPDGDGGHVTQVRELRPCE